MLHPSHDYARLLIAECLNAEEQTTLAAREFEYVLTQSRDSSLQQRAWAGMALLYLHGLGDPTRALQAFDQASQFETPMAKAVREQWAVAALALGQTDLARKITRDLGVAELPSNLDRLPTGTERIALAASGIETFVPVPKTTHADRSPDTILADTLFTAMEYRRAFRRYGTAQTKSRTEEERGYCILQQARCAMQLLWDKETAELLSRFQTSLKDNPWAPEGLIRLGVFHLGPRHDAKSATRVFRLLAENYPGDPQAERAQYYLVLTHAWTGQKRQAVRELDLLASRYPSSIFLSGAEKDVAALR